MVSAVDGYIAEVDTEALGYLVIEMGGGRKTKSDAIDPRVGIEFLVQVGDRMERGDLLARVHVDKDHEYLADRIRDAVQLSDTAG